MTRKLRHEKQPLPSILPPPILMCQTRDHLCNTGVCCQQSLPFILLSAVPSSCKQSLPAVCCQQSLPSMLPNHILLSSARAHMVTPLEHCCLQGKTSLHDAPPILLSPARDLQGREATFTLNATKSLPGLTW